MSEYPPEPWDLRGQLHASVFLVPQPEVPLQLPPGWRPVRLGRRCVVGGVWVDYEPGGVLTYHELMTTVLVRRGLRVLPTITHIWVDSAASRDGGRALWGIPKELAGFEFGADRYVASLGDATIASASVRSGVRLPGRLAVRFAVVQSLGGRAKASPVRARAHISLLRACWRATPSGPLAFLAGRRPLASISLRDFRMTFGG